MGSATDGFGSFCGALVCTADVDVVIRHLDHSERTVSRVVGQRSRLGDPEADPAE